MEVKKKWLTNVKGLIKTISCIDFILCFIYFYFPGPIATFLMNHMSHRKVALLGAVLSSAGLIAMPFAPNLVYMYGFYGVLSGNKKDTSWVRYYCIVPYSYYVKV